MRCVCERHRESLREPGARRHEKAPNPPLPSPCGDPRNSGSVKRDAIQKRTEQSALYICYTDRRVMPAVISASAVGHKYMNNTSRTALRVIS